MYFIKLYLQKMLNIHKKKFKNNTMLSRNSLFLHIFELKEELEDDV